MSDLSNNIRFSYLYRDYGNYKLFGETIFSNTEKINLTEIESRIKSRLIDGEFFNPEDWGIVRLSFENHDYTQDHDWHEYDGVELTEDEKTNILSISEFLKVIKN